VIIAVINNKGGTGKTTTSVSLGAAFAELGYNVLVVDMDPQSSASIYLGATSGTLFPSVSNIIFDGMRVKSAIRRSSTPGMDFLTADPSLYEIDSVLADELGRENRLRAALDAVGDDYDFIICDCPPSFSLISVNVLVAADAYILPVTPDYLALEDVSRMIDMVEKLRDNMAVAIDAELLGIVVTMAPTGRPLFSSEARLARDNIRELRDYYQDDVCSTEIRMDVKLAESPAYGATIFGTAPSSRGAKEYRALAEELIQRCGILKLRAESRRMARLRRQARGAISSIHLKE
jgi:chromosome partitioning protein